MAKEKLRSEISDEYKWDLTKFIKDEKELDKKLEQLDKAFKKLLSYKGKIMESPETLYNLYIDQIKYSNLESDVCVYVSLLYDEDTTNEKNNAKKLSVYKKIEDYSPSLAFINNEILESDYEKVKEFIKSDKRLEEFAFDLEKMFRHKEHILSLKEEELISEASKAFGVGSEVHSKLDNSDIDLGEIEVDGELVKLTNSNYTKFLKSKDRDVRKNAFNNMYNYWKSIKNTVSVAYKGQIKEDFFYSKVRKFSSPLEASLYSDKISVNLYDTLINTVHDNLDKMYRYINIRKKMLGLKEIHFYDIYVDLAKEIKNDVPFEEGKKILFKALALLGEDYLNDLNKSFDEKWIDIYPNKGKKSGAYKWGTYNSGPFVLLNYENGYDDVSTMAHELGHAMHSYYSNKRQSYVYASYPIFLAEIASTVNEVILNDYFIRNAKNKEEKIYFINDFLDKIRVTLYRQTMFAEFERIMHDKEEKGIPLTLEEFNNTYYKLNKLYFGPDMTVDEDIKYEWMRIPHFYTPFYVYKYATGISAACAIASDILKDESARDKYLEFLSSGCSDYPLEILKRVGVDMESGEPIRKALELFDKRLDELEELIK